VPAFSPKSSFPLAWKRRLWGDLRFLLLLLPVCTALGALANVLRPDFLPWFEQPGEDVFLARSVAPGAAVELCGQKEPEELGLEEARSLQASGAACWVDARDPLWFEQGHIPGARSLPRRHFAEQYAAFAAEVGRDTPLAVYCSDSGCGDSRIVARALLRLGYRNVSVFPGGWQEWSEAGVGESR
jgi:rhodanese-related sulfurtransferase